MNDLLSPATEQDAPLTAMMDGLPSSLQTAQHAIHLPEVQEMLERLSVYNLGIYMPHEHDEQTGEFLPIQKDVIQVEDGMVVTFRPVTDILPQMDEYVMTGWIWKEGAPSVAANCHSVCKKRGTDTNHYNVHRDKGL